MAYQINLPVFEGPFDLLLHLVKVNEMEISDINIAQITDQYLKALRAMQDLDLEVAGEFLVMAATLINLKIRALLPEQPGEEEAETEEISEIMSAKALMDQLIEYRKFKELSVDLGTRQEEQMRMFYRNSLLPALQEAQENPPLKAELTLMFDCFSRVLRYVESLPHHDVAFEPFSVEQRIGVVRGRLKTNATLELFALFRECRNKADMIVTLLAMLELSRLREIRLEQSKAYEEVFIYRRDPEEPPADAPPVEAEAKVVPAGRKGEGLGERGGGEAEQAPGEVIETPVEPPHDAAEEEPGGPAPDSPPVEPTPESSQSPANANPTSVEDVSPDGQ